MLLSIIIPTKNRAERLKFVLLSIQHNQVQDTAYEVIVIDNGSSDETPDVCRSFEGLLPNYSYVYDERPGLLTGRHRGASLAKGEILCFLDDDVELNPNYINSVRLAFEDSGVTIATGPCLPRYESYPPKWLDYFWTDEQSLGRWCGWLSLLDFGGDRRKIDPNFVWGLNFVIRKATLLELEGFHPDITSKEQQHFQGDGETGLTLKAQQKGIEALYHPGLLVYHYVNKERTTEAYFVKRAFGQGIFNSFTDLRKIHRDGKPQQKKPSFRDKIHPYYRWIKLLMPQPKQDMPAAISALRQKLAQAEQEGYQSHQMAFKNDKNVRKWVLQDNYWNYDPPANS